jgi:hypothetical protein
MMRRSREERLIKKSLISATTRTAIMRDREDEDDGDIRMD